MDHQNKSACRCAEKNLQIEHLQAEVERLDFYIRAKDRLIAEQQAQLDQRPEAVVDAILKDLTGRRGLAQMWAEIDPDTQADIREKWLKLAGGQY